MATIRQVYNNIHAVKFEKVVEDTIKSVEPEIIRLNVNQMQDGEGNDGNNLKHSNKRFKGTYTKMTAENADFEATALPKRAGELYNFGWTGDFLANLQMKIDNREIKIFSTGTGSGDKAMFFSGFKTLFGLNAKSRTELIEKTLRKKLVTNYKTQAKLI